MEGSRSNHLPSRVLKKMFHCVGERATIRSERPSPLKSPSIVSGHQRHSSADHIIVTGTDTSGLREKIPPWKDRIVNEQSNPCERAKSNSPLAEVKTVLNSSKT